MQNVANSVDAPDNVHVMIFNGGIDFIEPIGSHELRSIRDTIDVLLGKLEKDDEIGTPSELRRRLSKHV